jgi:thiazole synthase
MKDFYKIMDIAFYSRLWVCVAQNFRTGTCSLAIDVAVQVIRQSDTDIIVLHIPSKEEFFEKENNYCSIEELKEQLQNHRYIDLISTNLATSSKEAVEMAKRGVQSTGAKLIKLDVLDENNCPDNNEVYKAAEKLVSVDYKNVIPFIKPDVAIARRLMKLGIPAIRILASEIGSKRGIDNPENIKKICDELAIPVIVEGGIGDIKHAKEAMLLGATAILINSAIVKSNDPVAMTIAMKRAVIEGRNEYLST